jgi:voltage-gated potassium channel Kch
MRRPTRASAVGWVVLAAVAVSCGAIGWALEGVPPLDVPYRTLQLFVLAYPEGVAQSPPHPVLQIGRYLAALTTGYAVVSLSAGFVARRATEWRKSRLSDHVVVVGCGRTGSMIVESLRGAGIGPIAVVDRSSAALQSAAHLDALQHEGDGRHPRSLQRVRVDRAAHVFVAVREWGVMTAAAQAARRARPDSVPTVSHIADLTLCQKLRLKLLSSSLEPSVTGPTDVFNFSENAAQALLRPFDDALACKSQAVPRLVVVGYGALTEALLLQAGRSWAASRRSFGLQILLVDSNAAAVREEILGRCPELVALEDTIATSSSAPMRFATEEALRSTDLVLVAIDDVDHGMAVGAVITERVPEIDCVVVGERPVAEGDVHGVQVVDVAGLAFSRDVLFEDSFWLLAHHLHETYRQTPASAGSPSAVPWDELPPAVRQDNRAAARFLVRNLHAHGLRLASIRDLDPRIHPVDLADLVGPEAIDGMARAEHARWLARRQASELPPERYGEAWDDLDDEARDIVHQLVGAYPRLLLRLGFTVTLTGDAHAAPAHALAASGSAASDEEIAHLLSCGSWYRRVGRVTGRRLYEPLEWVTDSGEVLRGAPGDWLVESGADRWTVTDPAFRAAYTEDGDGWFTRNGHVRAVRLGVDLQLTTPEGPALARSGDWLVQNERGDVWPVSHETFRQRYTDSG